MHLRPCIIWNTLPMLRMLAPFAAGIVAGFYFTPEKTPILLALGICCLLLLALHLAVTKWLWSRYPASLLSHLTLILLGVFLSSSRLPTTLPDAARQGIMLATVAKVPESRPKSERVILQIEGHADTTVTLPVKVLILAYFAKDSAVSGLLPGDRIWISSRLQPIVPPANPGMFDFSKYMRYKGVGYTAYIAKGHWGKASGTDHNMFIRRHAANVNEKIQTALFSYLPDHKDRALVAGILLGSKAQLDDQTRTQFTRSGIMHILSVSGMHVGILYGILLLLFRGIPAHHRRMQLTIDGFTLLVIWLFAFVTGLSPAVQRAAFMFSLIILGKLLNRKAASINLVGGSAFVLLLFDPGLLFHIGFQLSYAAVAGIVLWYQSIYRLWYAPNKFVDVVWQTCSISICAQLATAPLCWYYFGQIPIYFLFGNLLAMPLAPAIMSLGLALAAFSPVAVIAKPLAFLLHWTNFALLEGTNLIARLPGAGDTAGFLPPNGVWLLFVSLTGFSIALMLYRKHGWWIAMSSLLLLFSQLQWQKWQSSTSEEVIVWHIPGHTAITARTGGHIMLWADSTLTRNKTTLSYHMDGYLKQHGAVISASVNLDSTAQQYIIAGGKTIGLYHGFPRNLTVRSAKTSVPADVLIIRNNPYLDTAMIFRLFDPAMIVADGSNYASRKSLYKRLLNLPETSTGEAAMKL
jgi:competence protein ComEC